jgi:hypothetical protein
MRVSDVSEIVSLTRVDQAYCGYDSDKREALCLLAEGQKWKVFLCSEASTTRSTPSITKTKPALNF